VRRAAATTLGLVVSLVLMTGAIGVSSASAQSKWRLEQPAPPRAAAGVPEAPGPVGLGKVGDIAFWSPNLGALITAGNPETILPGVWLYDGTGWHELSTECGGSEGRIAWAGPNEFWTISNGRPGQADVNGNPPPLENNTLCRFADGKILESFAAPAFEADSYQQMRAAACLSPTDCWFGGLPLPRESAEIGAFQLHWNGTSLTEVPYPEEAHAIEDMQAFGGRLYESVRLLPPCQEETTTECDQVAKELAYPPAIHVFEPELSSGFEAESNLRHGTLYGSEEEPWGLDYLHLSAGTNSLWAAAGQRQAPTGGTPETAQATVLRFTPEAETEWTQVLGPNTVPSGMEAFSHEAVEAIAVEPGGGEENAWLALQTLPEALETERGEAKLSTPATVAQVSEDGEVRRLETLPSESESKAGIVARGPAHELSCPAAGDCWMVTADGWLFHLAPETERTLSENTESSFGELITERPPDQGLPQTEPDSLPEDDSGLVGELPKVPVIPTVSRTQEELRVPVALVSKLHSRLVKGTTLELRFHLAVKARIRLVAKRKHHVVASSPTYTFGSGIHKIMLRLSRDRWPTELHLVEHPLAPLPTISTRSLGSESVTTSLVFPAHPTFDWSGLLR
jgi:hypothetical protein